MPVFNLHHLGRFGNNMFAYAFARGFCERNGLELHTDPWVGQKIFALDDPPCEGDLPRKDEFTITDSDKDISYRSYSQQQRCLDYYSRGDCWRWFNFHPGLARRLTLYPGDEHVAHHRKGDYFWDGSAYPVVSRAAYETAFARSVPQAPPLRFVSEENAFTDVNLGPELEFVPDFVRLVKATKTLFRANSSFSWWAGVLTGATVYSPIVAHLHGGKEHDNVEFVEGNWPRLAAFEYTTDLHLKP